MDKETKKKVKIGVSIGLGVVAVGTIGYLGYRLKTADDELQLIKFLVIESDCIPKAMQNGENKLSRVRSKIAAEVERIALNPNDLQTLKSLDNHRKEESILIKHLSNTIKLDEAIKAEKNIYSK